MPQSGTMGAAYSLRAGVAHHDKRFLTKRAHDVPATCEDHAMGLHLHSIAGEADKRVSSGESVRFTATLNYGETSMSCTVRDISSTGASVLMTDGRHVPDDVILSIVGKPIRC